MATSPPELGEGPTANTSPPVRRWTPRTFLIPGFASAGIFHLAIAALSRSVVEIPLSAQLGLLQLLPPTYWFGLALIVVAVVLALRERSEAWTVVTGVLLLAVFAGTPSLFEPNPRYWDAYIHLSDAQGIQFSGHLPTLNIGQYSANWPGVFTLVAMLSQASAIPAIPLLALYPFVVGGITFLAIFVFFRSTFPRTVAGPAAILASFSAVWAQFHLSPQSFGFVLALLVLALVWRRGSRMRAVCATLFVGLVISHPTSTLILLAILVVMSFFGLFWGRRAANGKEDIRFTRRVTIAYGTTWLAWLYFHATNSSQVAETAIFTRIGALISLPESTLNLAASRTVENLFPLAPRLRLGSLFIFGLLGFLSLLLLRRDARTRPLTRFLFSAVVALGLIAAADVLGFGGQFYDRCLLFFATLAPAICLTGIEKLPRKKWLQVGMVGLLVGASAAAASTAYYNEAFNLVTDEAVATSQFFERVPTGSLIADGMFPPSVWIDLPYRTFYVRETFLEAYPTPLKDLGGTTTYAVFDRTAQLWYLQWRGADVLYLYEQEQTNLSRIYDNGRSAVWFLGG